MAPLAGPRRRQRLQAGPGGRHIARASQRELDELRREIAERSISSEKTWWGCDTIRIVDPDGNELFFPLDETNDRERQA